MRVQDSHTYLGMPGQSCVFYQHKRPDAVNVRPTAEMGAYVSLLEYNTEGMILLR